MKQKRLTFILLILALVLAAACVSGETTPLQECHKVTSTAESTTQKNKSVIRFWHVETALDSVTEEVNGIAEAWASELGPELPAAKNTGKKNSRLDVEIRYSRTGLRWMSFLVQARTTYHQEPSAQRVTTRTYDMTTGERI